MTTNESTIDRIIRAILGLAALAGALVIGLASVLGIVLAAVGAVLLVTAAIGFCPLYKALRISTNRTPSRL